ncbi:MAG TPA: hypothetical protein VFA90_15740 [Terriglobales bacterium]|nr:hypothetical protein [Terriglobales bacterium]
MSDPDADLKRKEQPAQGSAVSGIDEDAALRQLKNAELSAEILAALARSPVTAKSRKVMLAVVQHARTPRHVSIPLLRRMFTFDVMQVTLTPVVAADVKRSAEDQMIVRLESIPVGQKITLARRASGRVAAELLYESDTRVVSPALENPQLTEALLMKALMTPASAEVLFSLVSQHAKWSLRREIQVALLRSEKTPIERVRQLAKHFPEKLLRDILPQNRKNMIM